MSEMENLSADVTILPRPSVHEPPICLHELFEAQVDQQPDAIALVRDSVSITYAELEKRANQLARYLRKYGVQRGARIGLALERSELPIIAILAVLKAGAAYVPIDPTHPNDRIRHILEEANVIALLVEETMQTRSRDLFSGTIITLDATPDIGAQPDTRLPRAETGVTPGDLCYVIYTSGTTGRPKGVMTEHRNVTHFVPAFNKICITTPQDRIYQGFSLGFDGSVEEIWMAFSNGATLVVGTKDTPRFGNDLAQYLSQKGVTYFSTVPTLLSTMTDPIPSLRQLVVSGEVCSPELVARWARPGRLMLNVYGPTEATVNTTAFICQAGQPVTIGRTLEGYEALILDSGMREVPRGTMGELYIASAGIARGYMKQPELTAKHFLTLPQDSRRLYRTGDLASLAADGELTFFGRADDQVKIRGFRVELSEIVAVLLEQPGIASAAVRLHEHDGVDALAAYIVLETTSVKLQRTALVAALRDKLPAYMMPRYLDVLSALPMLSTGKVDRKKLPAPVLPLIDQEKTAASPMTALEAEIASVWAALFKIDVVGVEQDFFLDLAGHSLLAARVVSLLRDRANVHVAVRDIYAHPTIRALAAYVDAIPKSDAPAASKSIVQPIVLRKPSTWFTTAQMACIVVFGAILALPLLVIIPVADDLLRQRINILQAIVILFPFGIAMWILLLAIGLSAKWIIIGRYKPGAYPLWGAYHFRCWLAGGFQALAALGAVGTPLLPFYFRLMGAKVGRDCALDSGLTFAYDLVSIGNDTSIGADTQFPGWRVENGWMILGRIDIGNRCFVGAHSMLGLNVRMEDDARLDDQSLLADGETIPAGKSWRGSPARLGKVAVPAGEPLRYGLGRKIWFCVAIILATNLLGWFSAAPGIAVLLGWIWAFNSGWLPLVVIGSAIALPMFVVTTCLWIAMMKAIILRRDEPGTYPLYSTHYMRHWLAYGLMRATRGVLLPVFTTIYLPPFMRLLGAKLGAHTEMSTVWSFMPEMINARDGVFFADGSLIGGRRTFGGRWQVAMNHIGERSFIGNGAMLPTGTSLGDRCLLGVLSAPPLQGERTPDGTDWLGSPSFRLPNRQIVGGFDEKTTFQPTLSLYFQRAIVDACRILIPGYAGFAFGLAGIVASLYTYEVYGALAMLGVVIALGWMFAILAVLLVVALKWVVMGRFKPVIVPLWCRYVWFNEMINGAYESIMSPVVSAFYGTALAAPILRALGCKIGQHCYIGSALFSEFDLIEIGDYVALNTGSVVQNHLFEDRVMKSSHLRIDDGCTIGNMSVVLYDSHLQRGSVLKPLSLIMKGEVIPAETSWQGIPTSRC